ncbi:hypothetical protein TSUD_42600 [Trifolium subterraneum]|uniref:RNase H type-1 domain-containing protein n=1 Tax=Trifolium subterraneum TaxID=3900 RepID=A0A2Z6LHF7_TRISU|nr:hypothetical protein TSUD_42600 [Trifolium subterraneum]
MGIWSLWWRRKGIIWENVNWSTIEVVRRAVQTLEDWRQACAKDKPAAARQQNSVGLHRRKPVTGSLKCNIEAALFKDDNSFGCGICMCDDEQGVMVEARSAWFRGTPTPTQ